MSANLLLFTLLSNLPIAYCVLVHDWVNPAKAPAGLKDFIENKTSISTNILGQDQKFPVLHNCVSYGHEAVATIESNGTYSVSVFHLNVSPDRKTKTWTVASTKFTNSNNLTEAQAIAERYMKTAWFDPHLSLFDTAFVNEYIYEGGVYVDHRLGADNRNDFSEYKEKMALVFMYPDGKHLCVAICVLMKIFGDGAEAEFPQFRWHVLGYFQKIPINCDNTPVAQVKANRAIGSYFEHPKSFSTPVLLSSLYSGDELDAETFFERTIQTQVKTAMGKRFHNKDMSESKFVRGWVLGNGEAVTNDKGYVGIYRCEKQLFFVVHSKDLNDRPSYRINKIDGFVFGPLCDKEHTLNINLLDYIKGTKMLGVMNSFTGHVNLYASGNNAVAVLSYGADFAARQLVHESQSDPDRTPLININFAIAKVLMEQHNITNLALILAVFLHNTIGPNCSYGIIENHFKSDVTKYVKAWNDRNQSDPILQIESSSRFDDYKVDEEQRVFEGSPVAMTLIALLEERRKSKGRKCNPAVIPPNFKISFVKSFALGKKDFGIFNLTNDASPEEKGCAKPEQFPFRSGISYSFSLEVSKLEYDSKDYIIVGECVKSDTHQLEQALVEIYNRAKFFEALYRTRVGASQSKPDTWQMSNLFVPIPQLNSYPVHYFLYALEYATRKHFFDRRKGENEEPYFNHLIGVAEIPSQLEEYGGSLRLTTMFIASVLHDSVENTTASLKELEYLFGQSVKRLVEAVTDKKPTTSGNPDIDTMKRKAAQVGKALVQLPDEALLKTADKVYNLYDFWTQISPGFTQGKRMWYLEFTTQIFVSYVRNIETDQDGNWKRQTNKKFRAPFKTLLGRLAPMLLDNRHQWVGNYSLEPRF